MGWNSWDCFGTTVTEAEVLENAEWMARELLPHGWDTVVVDIQWQEPTPRTHGYAPVSTPVLDARGRPQPAPNRFPSAVEGRGFAPLAARIHDMGLRFGVHIMRGLPRLAAELAVPIPGTDATTADIAMLGDACTWNPDNVGIDHEHPAAQSWVDAQVAQLAEWGVDLIKADDMLWPFREADIRALRQAIDASGRPIVLSLSPGRSVSTTRAATLAETAEMWRISDDLWDRWGDVHDQFARAARWAPFGGDGRWTDLDMLPLGRIGIRAERGEDRLSLLTIPEQRTMITLWCIARSPLMFGGHLPDTPAETTALLRVDAVLHMLRDARRQREVVRDKGWVAWAADGVGEFAAYAAVFRVADETGAIRTPLADLDLPDGTLVDLWTGAELEVVESPVGPAVEYVREAHDVLLIGVRRE